MNVFKKQNWHHIDTQNVFISYKNSKIIFELYYRFIGVNKNLFLLIKKNCLNCDNVFSLELKKCGIFLGSAKENESSPFFPNRIVD